MCCCLNHRPSEKILEIDEKIDVTIVSFNGGKHFMPSKDSKQHSMRTKFNELQHRVGLMFPKNGQHTICMESLNVFMKVLFAARFVKM